MVLYVSMYIIIIQDIFCILHHSAFRMSFINANTEIQLQNQAKEIKAYIRCRL